jgi:integrase
MLTLRKRGPIWHVRGSIRVGGETRRVKEHSTGCHRREDAETYRAGLETRVREELLHGAAATAAQQLTIADAGLRYVGRPGGVRSYDLWRLDQLNELIGDYAVVRAPEGWAEFKRQRCGGLAPATVDRFRSVLQAALNYAATEGQFVAPKIRRTERIQNRRIRFLTADEQERLLNAYSPHVRPIAITLCYQGLRIGEALRLDWRDVNWAANALFIADTKSGVPRVGSHGP